MGIPRLEGYLVASGMIIEDNRSLQRKIRTKVQAVDYLMGDASGLVFELVL